MTQAQLAVLMGAKLMFLVFYVTGLVTAIRYTYRRCEVKGYSHDKSILTTLAVGLPLLFLGPITILIGFARACKFLINSVRG
jgi:hypothetical protein